MAHYAEIDENNIVINVFSGIDEDQLDDLPEEFTSWEEFYTDLKGNTVKRTSYNTSHNEHKVEGKTAFRGNYAGIGYTYDPENDVFIQPAKSDQEVLNTNTWTYDPPNTKPTPENDNQDYAWDPPSSSWILIDLKDPADFDWDGTNEDNF